MTIPVQPGSPNINDPTAAFQQQMATMGLQGGQGAGMAPTSARLSENSRVYVGSWSTSGQYGPFTSKVPQYMNYGEARLAPRDWSAAQTKEFVNKGILYKVPGFEADMGLPEIMQQWDSMLQLTYELNKGATEKSKKWTPLDILNSYNKKPGSMGTKREGDWLFDLATGERIKYMGPTSKTTTSKSLDLSSPEEVQALVTQVLREALGRAPNEKELAKFKATIGGYEESHPEVTTTTQQLSPNLATGEVDVTGQTSTTKGGVSDAARAQLVQSPTEDTKEYGKFQAGTTYFNALMSMVGGG